MIEDIEKRGFIFDSREKEPKLHPKGDELQDDEDLTMSKQSEAEREIAEEKLTNEAWKEYEKEMTEITQLAKEKEIDFKKVRIAPDREEINTKFKHPDAIFLPTVNFLDNYRQARKFLSKEEIYQGLRVKFLEMKNLFQSPKIDICKEYKKIDDRFKERKDKIETDDRELIKKTNTLLDINEEIENKGKELDENSKKTLTDFEIKEQTHKHIILNILYMGPENSQVIKMARLKKSRDEGKISEKEYDKQFIDLPYGTFKIIRKEFPNLDEDTRQKLGEEWLNTTLEKGKKYQEYEDKKNKYDYGAYG